MKQWAANLPWTQKNGFIALLMNQLSDVIKPIMEDGLNSNMPENRAAVLCLLKKDFALHNTLYDKKGWVIKKRLMKKSPSTGRRKSNVQKHYFLSETLNGT